MRQNEGDRGGTRLETLRRSLLMDSPSEPSFDRVTGLVAELLEVPVALVSLVGGNRQFFKSSVGLPEPWCTRRETPLSHSFCQYVVATDRPLVVEDARDDPVLRSNLAVPDIGVVAYAGVPVRFEGSTLGSLCAIDTVPRSWSDRDLALLTTLAALVEDLVVLRLGSLARARAQREVNEELRGMAAVNRRLQRALLPRPEETTVHGFAVSAAYRAGSRHMLVGGDFADVRPGAEGAIDFVIGDVTGHGPEAAALGAALRSAWNAFSSAGTPTAGMLEALNETLIRERQEPGLMATAIAGSVSADGSVMSLSIAAHPSPVLVSEDPEEVAIDVARVTLLGLAEATRWPIAAIPLEGRSGLLFTDGLVEVRPGGGEYGTSALVLDAVRQFCREDSGRSLPAVLLEMATEANGGPLADDAAVLHIRADGAG